MYCIVSYEVLKLDGLDSRTLHLSSVGAPVWYNDDREHDYGRDPAILLLMCSSEEKRMIPFL